MKKTLVLAGDRWHSPESVASLLPLLFSSPEKYLFSTDPADFLKEDYAALITFKDPLEDSRTSALAWCDEKWTVRLLTRVENGMGYIAVHAALTDLPQEHWIPNALHEGVFLRHPAQCTVAFEPVEDHPILKGIDTFVFPAPDEQYEMSMLPEARSILLANTVTEHGRQPALWINLYGKGRTCMLTLAHNTENLTCSRYVHLMKNMLRWVTGQ